MQLTAVIAKLPFPQLQRFGANPVEEATTAPTAACGAPEARKPCHQPDGLVLSAEARLAHALRTHGQFGGLDATSLKILEMIREMEKPQNTAAEVKAIGAQINGTMSQAIGDTKQKEIDDLLQVERAERERSRMAQDVLVLSAQVVALAA